MYNLQVCVGEVARRSRVSGKATLFQDLYSVLSITEQRPRILAWCFVAFHMRLSSSGSRAYTSRSPSALKWARLTSAVVINMGSFKKGRCLPGKRRRAKLAERPRAASLRRPTRTLCGTLPCTPDLSSSSGLRHYLLRRPIWGPRLCSRSCLCFGDILLPINTVLPFDLQLWPREVSEVLPWHRPPLPTPLDLIRVNRQEYPASAETDDVMTVPLPTTTHKSDYNCRDMSGRVGVLSSCAMQPKFVNHFVSFLTPFNLYVSCTRALRPNKQLSVTVWNVYEKTVHEVNCEWLVWTVNRMWLCAKKVRSSVHFRFVLFTNECYMQNRLCSLVFTKQRQQNWHAIIDIGCDTRIC